MKKLRFTALNWISQSYTVNSRKRRGTKEPPDEGEREEWKAGLKLNIQKMKIMVMASGPITSWQIGGETVEAVIDFIFLDSKTTVDGWLQPRK